jgi:hypothetical protein
MRSTPVSRRLSASCFDMKLPPIKPPAPFVA